jgi:rSAM/selenodomain-associated transferase 1
MNAVRNSPGRVPSNAHSSATRSAFNTGANFPSSRRGRRRRFTVAVLRTILLFVKYPEPGRVKTRLAASVGALRAAAIYRRLATAVFARLPRDADIVVMFDPPERAAEVEAWLGAMNRPARFLPQSSGDLGTRLERAFDAAFARGEDKVAAIGSDCIDLTCAIFAEMWQALDTHDCVIGPVEDGGYYLVALRKTAPLFRDIAWSEKNVLAQTIARAREHGLRVHLLPTLHDIDTADDWERAEPRLPTESPPSCPPRI